jgi:hypothetical protein
MLDIFAYSLHSGNAGGCTMSTYQKVIRWSWFWFFWVLTTLAGLLVHWALFQASGVESEIISTLGGWIGSEGVNLRLFEFATYGVLGLIDGIFLGLFQWVALRRKIKRALNWIPATALGYAVGLIAFWALFVLITGDQLPPGNPAEWGFEVGLLRIGLAGLVVGLSQALVLRRQVRRPGWWALTFLLGMVSSWLVRWFVSIGLAFVVLGAVTGIVLTIYLADREHAYQERAKMRTPMRKAPGNSL